MPMRTIACALALCLSIGLSIVTAQARSVLQQGRARDAIPAAEDPSKIPIIGAGDVAKLREHFGKRAIVVGVVKSAQWSGSGKVMNIEFAEGEGKGLLAVVFESSGQRFNEAWGGDFVKAVTGKRVRLYGQVQEYGGYDEKWKGRPQMILGNPEQVSLPVEASAGASGGNRR